MATMDHLLGPSLVRVCPTYLLSPSQLAWVLSSAALLRSIPSSTRGSGGDSELTADNREGGRVHSSAFFSRESNASSATPQPPPPSTCGVGTGATAEDDLDPAPPLDLERGAALGHRHSGHGVVRAATSTSTASSLAPNDTTRQPSRPTNGTKPRPY
nr:unnamed protein product [Digitaria exilis]